MTTNLEEHYQAQREHFEVILDALDKGRELPEEYGSSDPDDAFRESALAVEVVRHVKIALTLGGPNIWLDAELDSGGDVREVTCHAYWGGDSFQRTLSHSDPLYRAAERFAEVAAYA